MSKILVAGCSLSDTNLWDNPNGKIWHHKWSTDFGGRHEVTNCSKDAASNQQILLSVISELTKSKFDLVVVQWTSLLRLQLYSGKHDEGQVVNFLSNTNINPRVREYTNFHKLWVTNFLNIRLELRDFLLQLILVSEFLNHRNQDYIFYRAHVSLFPDTLKPNWKDCSERYQLEVLRRGKVPEDESNMFHQELHQLALHLVSISGPHWVSLDGLSIPDINVDFADDGIHPGVKTCDTVRLLIEGAATRLGYAYV